MEIKLIPITIRCGKRDGYGLTILGFDFNYKEQGIGFNFYNEKCWDRTDKMFVFYFYHLFIKRIKIKEIKKSHYICNHCKTPVSPNDRWCNKCDEELTIEEVTFINIS